MKQLKPQNWPDFRKMMFEVKGAICADCGRGKTDDVILQVHHKKYIAGREPWDYALEDCEVLCRGCHAREHGLIPPNHEWTLGGESDLEDLVGSCDLCGTSIRYVFHIFHPNWMPMDVGTNCCDLLTGTKEASKAEADRRKLATFLNSNRWCSRGLRYKKSKYFVFSIVEEQNQYRIYVNLIKGKKTYPSIQRAKEHIFHFINSGEIDNWFNKDGTRVHTSQ